MLVPMLILFIPLFTIIIGMGVIAGIGVQPQYRVLGFILGLSAVALPLGGIATFLLLAPSSTGVPYFLLVLVGAAVLETALLCWLLTLY